MTIELWIILLSFILSAFYSGSEAAFYSANKLKLSIFKKEQHRGAKLAIEFIKSPSRYLSTILVGNNAANVLFGSYMAIMLKNYYSETMVVGLSTILILVFAEIIPKSISRVKAEKVAMQNVYGVRLSEIIFYPLIKVLDLMSRIVSHYINHEKKQSKTKISEKEISYLFQESRYRGLIHTQDENFIQNVIHLKNVKARQVMIHRTDIYAIPVTTPIKKVQKEFIRRQFSRLPVYDGTLDEIIGVVNSLDVLQEPASMSEIIRDVLFIPESKPVLAVLQELRQMQASLAIVIDEYGGTAGLLTMEDIFEEIFGNIEDEHDEPGDFIEKLNKSEYRVRGRVEIADINDQLHFRLPIGEYETIAGLVISKLGKIPTVGEHVELAECKITVTRATRTAVSMVRLQLHTKP
ncbi:MAG: HlyC/CorC family transporter [Calditrichaeota bacterium]|nr:MAG: HlyC/CorC family transporter [Calditrichota bacterium]